MIDAHLLLNLGRPQGEGLLLGASGPAPGSAEKGQQFAEALRQVHATGRQELAAAPMQLRIIGSALRVVTPARNLELEAQGEALASPKEESGSPVLAQPQARGDSAQDGDAAQAIEVMVSTAVAPTVDNARALKLDEINYQDEISPSSE